LERPKLRLLQRLGDHPRKIRILCPGIESGNEAMRAKLGMPAKLGSCHTARVGGYVIEGHVPVREIRRLLHEQPKAIGLTVPGMVVGSPGMDGPSYKGRKEPYSVLLVNLNGESSIFQKYDALVNSAPTSKTKN
jgi:hypothetical protein